MGLEKLNVKFLNNANSKKPIEGRRYTLTHSDFTGDLFLSIGFEYDKKAISGFYTKLMRDEVLAEWLKQNDDYALHVYCHVSGGITFGTAGWRYSIFNRELPLVLKCICNGDKEFLEANPDLKNSSVIIHFKSKKEKYNKIKFWGIVKNNIT